MTNTNDTHDLSAPTDIDDLTDWPDHSEWFCSTAQMIDRVAAAIDRTRPPTVADRLLDTVSMLVNAIDEAALYLARARTDRSDLDGQLLDLVADLLEHAVRQATNRLTAIAGGVEAVH